MDVAIHKAKADLTKLIAAAERGERVILTRHGRPVVELKPVGGASGFDFSADDPDRAEFGLAGAPVPVAPTVDDHALSRAVLGRGRRRPG